MDELKEVPNIRPIKVIRNEKGEKMEVVITYQSYLEIMESLQDLIDANLFDEVRDEPRISWAAGRKMRKEKSLSYVIS